MTYEVFLTNTKVPYLQQELGENQVEVIKEGEDGIHTVKITIKDEFDIMHLIHAGVRYGVNMKP